MSSLEVSLIVLSFNTLEFTRACLGALRTCREDSDVDYETIVIDNASGDGSVEMIRDEFPEVRLFHNAENVGYARGVNQGLRLATGRFLTLLGSDTEVRPGTLERLRDFLLEHPRAGAVAPRLVNSDGSLQRACMRFPDLNVALIYDTFWEKNRPDNAITVRYNYRDWSHDDTRQVDQPPGTCLMVRREVLEQVGPMDRKLWLYFNDVDWCLRMHRAGWEVWYLHDDTEVLHHLGQSTRLLPGFPIEWHRNRLHFYRKHYHLMGAVIVKSAMIYVAVREILKLNGILEDKKEFRAHASQIARALLTELVR